MAMNLISKLSIKRIKLFTPNIRLFWNKNKKEFKDDFSSTSSIVDPFESENSKETESEYLNNLMTDKDK